MSDQVSPAEIKRAQHLHAVLLFDFIVVHVFVFLTAASMVKTSIIPLVLMPVLSLALLGYVLLNAKRAQTKEASWFVRCHWLLAAKRARMFLALFLVTGTFTAVLYFGGPHLGMSPIATLALAFGLGQLPFMLTLLVLVVVEFDAEHHCRRGKVPASAVALSPPPAAG